MFLKETGLVQNKLVKYQVEHQWKSNTCESATKIISCNTQKADSFEHGSSVATTLLLIQQDDMMNDSHMVILLILVFLQTISSKQAFPLPRVDPVYVSLLISGLTAGIALDKVLSYSMYIIYHKHILPYFACTIIIF